MKKQIHIFHKINETGSMMIEALAMLTLISLVTPTLYKKSAERTTELQDINAATHARTLMKAVDNYTSTNYEALLNELKNNDSGQMTIELEQMADYLPYGYNMNEPIKNFGVPVISVQRQGDSDSLTSFVVFPKQGDITDLRASRIASMIGANGGYIDKYGKAKGVGGIWSLDSDKVSEICQDGGSDCTSDGSIITASNESINNASRASFENTKYLQRTPADDENAKWRNTMITDLYMGGVKNELGRDVNYNSIYGVNRLILGGTDSVSETADLVVKASNGRSGSGFFGGSLEALGGTFSLKRTGEDETTPEMNFANFIRATNEELEVGSVTKGSESKPAFHLSNETKSAQFNVNTAVDGTFISTGDTRVAAGTNADDSAASFYVGNNGAIMEAHTNELRMFDETFALTNVDNADASDLTIKTKTVELEGKTTIGNEADPANFTAQKVTNPQLLVKNNAVVQGALEAGEIDAHQFDTLELHAGAENFSDATRWLNADKDGVIVKDTSGSERLKVDAEMLVARDEEDNVRLSISNKTDTTQDVIAGTSLRGPMYKQTQNGIEQSFGQGEVFIGATNAGIAGIATTEVKTLGQDGTVYVQNGAIVANKQYDSTKTDIKNTVSVNSLSTDVNTDQFVVRDHNSNKLLNVVSNERGQELTQDSLAEIDPEAFHIWAARDTSTSDLNPNKHILEVNANSALPTDRSSDSNASVYIRRGAIEVEPSPATGGSYSADQGIGYIEASRFVDNSMNSDGSPLEPVMTKDSSNYGNHTYYDRYMINPAYTSVMHDIKLTTRGGARLSDILPDFINKGIYTVNNTYKEGVNFNNLTLKIENGRITPTQAQELTSLNYGSDWASPFMGIVPAPLCPPGYASVITLTPSSFQIGQAGELLKNGNDYYIQESGNLNEHGARAISSNKDNILTAEMKEGHTVTVDIHNPQAVTQNTIYYLGISADENTTSAEILDSPKPLYFQPSTWLKNKVIAYTKNGPYSGNNSDNFVGWAAIMGFIYPQTTYGNLINELQDRQGVQASGNNESFYWNVFPVRALSMEAYATVYCYFDRTNIFGSGNNPDYVDQYDQMNHFRSIHNKAGSTSNYGNGSSYGTNSSYTNRLNDPHLKYDDPW